LNSINTLNQKTTDITYNTTGDITGINNNVLINKDLLVMGNIANTAYKNMLSDVNIIKTDIINISDDINEIDNTLTDINYLDNLTQITGDFNVTGNSLFNNISFQSTINNISATTFNFLSGVSSNLQTQLNNITTFNTQINNELTGSNDYFNGLIGDLQSQLSNLYNGGTATLQSNIIKASSALFVRNIPVLPGASIGAIMLNGSDFVNYQYFTKSFFVCSEKNITVEDRDRDDAWVVMPGYKLIIYIDYNYLGAYATIDNTNGTNHVTFKNSQLTLNNGNVLPDNNCRSLKLYYNNVEIVFNLM
jgi:hypothetical protein